MILNINVYKIVRHFWGVILVKLPRLFWFLLVKLLFSLHISYHQNILWWLPEVLLVKWEFLLNFIQSVQKYKFFNSRSYHYTKIHSSLRSATYWLRGKMRWGPSCLKATYICKCYPEHCLLQIQNKPHQFPKPAWNHELLISQTATTLSLPQVVRKYCNPNEY